MDKLPKSTGLRKTARAPGPRLVANATIAADSLTGFLAELNAAEPTQEPTDDRAAESLGEVSAGPRRAPEREPVLERLRGGRHWAKFLLLADWFESATGGGKQSVWVVTDIGDVRFEVIEWIENPGFLKLVVDAETMPFQPRLMASMTLRKDTVLYRTTCISPLGQMLGGLPFSELILLIDGSQQLPTMDKNARIEPGSTPSVVSGKPSTNLDNEEPVADGEKAASLRLPLPDKDFDIPRGE